MNEKTIDSVFDSIFKTPRSMFEINQLLGRLEKRADFYYNNRVRLAEDNNVDIDVIVGSAEEYLVTASILYHELNNYKKVESLHEKALAYSKGDMTPTKI